MWIVKHRVPLDYCPKETQTHKSNILAFALSNRLLKAQLSEQEENELKKDSV